MQMTGAQLCVDGAYFSDFCCFLSFIARNISGGPILWLKAANSADNLTVPLQQVLATDRRLIELT